MLKFFNIEKNIIKVFSAQIVNTLLGFLTNILLVRYLGKQGQGEIALYNNITGLMVMIISFGIPTGLVHYLSIKKISLHQAKKLLLYVAGFGVVLLALLFPIIQNIFPAFYPDFIILHQWGFPLLIIHIVMLCLQQCFHAIHQAEGKFGLIGVVSLIGNVWYTLLIVALVSNWIRPFETIFFWVVMSMIFNFTLQVGSLWFYLPKYEMDNSFIHKNLLKSLFTFSAFALFTNLIQFFNYKMDLWFLNFFRHDKGEIGLYAVAGTLGQMVWLLPAAMQTILYQHVSAHHQTQSLKPYVYQQLKTILGYGIVAGALGYFLSPYILPWIFGKAFFESVHLFQYLLLGVVPFCLTMPISGYFAGSGRIRYNFYSALIGFVVCLMADLILIPEMGAMGAVWASVASYLATLFFLIMLFILDKTK